MPTYEFKCEDCGHGFEQFLPVKSRNLKVCPECRGKKLRRLISGGGGILFKGDGWTPKYHGDKK